MFRRGAALHATGVFKRIGIYRKGSVNCYFCGGLPWVASSNASKSAWSATVIWLAAELFT